MPAPLPQPNPVVQESSNPHRETDPASLLLIVLDCSSAPFAAPNTRTDHLTLLDHLATFLNAHLALNHDNRLAIVGATSFNSKFLFPAPPPPSQQQPQPKQNAPHVTHSNAYQQFFLMNTAFIAGVKSLIMQDADHSAASLATAGCNTGSECHLPSALSKALCYINRLNRESSFTPKSSILVVSASADSPAHYVPFMNTIFSAQKAGITIDACKLYTHSTFLQQATHLTKGIYQYLPSPDGMVQHLLFTFLAPPDLRTSLNFPASTHVDFRSACFCHQNMVSKAFVCSICLSIYCQWQPVCSTCNTKFPSKQQQ